jgi:hypothetical protein
MSKWTYRKKALPFLYVDFDKKCAYCLDPDELRHPNQTHIDHFDCKLPEKKRHRYRNLMLACSACNLSKLDKPVVNHYNPRQRLLNCTEENEFNGHIFEDENGQWNGISDEGIYHLESLNLREECHRKKRKLRKGIANQIYQLCSTAIQYKSHNPVETHHALMDTARQLLNDLDSFPPLITENGPTSVRAWMKQKGIDLGQPTLETASFTTTSKM